MSLERDFQVPRFLSFYKLKQDSEESQGNQEKVSLNIGGGPRAGQVLLLK